jgi:hypothetical protein
MGFYRHHFVSDPARGAANARRWENGGSLRREQALHYQSPICTIWNDATGANGTRITRAANQHHAKQDERAAKKCRICFKTRRYVEPARKKVRQRRRRGFEPNPLSLSSKPGPLSQQIDMQQLRTRNHSSTGYATSKQTKILLAKALQDTILPVKTLSVTHGV